MSIEHLEAGDLRQAVGRYRHHLQHHRDRLNRLNVYPVPDGDTGTNMALTVEAVIAAADGAVQMRDLAEALAHGSLMGAQGNSGIILSQVLRAFADVMRGHDRIGPGELASALERASQAAYAAVGSPTEGTILTVLRQSAETVAGAAGRGAGLEAVLEEGFRRALESLRETPQLLPVLAQAGVVDAGGAGYVLLLAALLEEVSGDEIEIPTELLEPSGPPVGGQPVEHAETGPRYEVMFLLEGGEEAGERLRLSWRDVGESVVVVGGEGEWNCHIHTDDIGAAIEAGIAMGRPHRIQVTDLHAQSAGAAFHEAPFEPLPGFANAGVGVVAVGAGDGVRELFRDGGAQGVVAGGQTMNPPVGALLDAVEAAPASTVVVLPKHKNVIPAAEQLDALTRKHVHVVPTQSVPQGLAAMLAYQPGGSLEEIIEAMTQAAAGCRFAELTRAVRSATTPIGEISEGDWIGLVDGTVALAGAEALDVAVEALEAIASGATELVTVIVGAEGEGGVVDAIVGWLSTHRPQVEVEIQFGGQPLYPYLFGAE